MLVLVLPIFFGACGNTVVDRQEPPTPTTSELVTPAPLPSAQPHISNPEPITPTSFSLAGIKASVVPVALDGNALTPPGDPKVLGWWGRRAGADQGTTLLIGHTVHAGGGALDDLEDIAVGTRTIVSGVEYVVKSNRVISKVELAKRASSLFSQSGPNRLVVVTCEDYDVTTGHYASNVVLVAEPRR